MPHISTIKNIVDRAFLEVINRRKKLKNAGISSSKLQKELNAVLSESTTDSILAYADNFESKANLEQLGIDLAQEHIERNEKAKEEGRPLIKRPSFNKESVLPEVKLRSGIELLGVYTPNQDEVFREGKAYIHFFPNGFAEPAMVYIGNGRDGVLTLTLNPLTGKVSRSVGQLDPDREFGTPFREEEEGR